MKDRDDRPEPARELTPFERAFFDQMDTRIDLIQEKQAQTTDPTLAVIAALEPEGGN